MRLTLCLSILTLLGSLVGAVQSPERVKDHRAIAAAEIADLGRRIRIADYAGDRKALRALFAELDPYMANGEVSRVRYWRGFSMWRRALNGFNESADSDDLEKDLTSATIEFENAIESDPKFVDAKAGAISCLSNLLFLRPTDARKPAWLTRAQVLAQEAVYQDSENPRLLWVLGANLWHAPSAAGGSQARAIETYQRGLKAARTAKTPVGPLDPTWGEPELLMSLAWSNLNRSDPDVATAEQYAFKALHLVPNWHYVRDILMPQIRIAHRAEALVHE